MKNKTFTVCVTILLILILAVTFIGLSKRKVEKSPEKIVSNLANPFTASATIDMDGLVMEGDINKTESGECTISIKEPKTLEGMKFAYDGEDITVSYKGLSIALDEDSKLVSSAGNIIVNAINKASSKEGVDITLDEKTIIVDGNCESGDFQIKMDKETGSMMSLNLPELDFECEFSN